VKGHAGGEGSELRPPGRTLWVIGFPARFVLIGAIRVYRVTLGGIVGGQCRFYPSCSVYAERAIRARGAVVGVALSVWRVLRCSPLSRGGVDHAPTARGAGTGTVAPYDDIIQDRVEATP
jgi:uncharacterized protein